MSSMLRLLSDGVSIQPMWARGGLGTPRAALLSGGTDDMVALPFELPAVPSNPASPLAVSRLPLVEWRDLNAMEEDFQLDGQLDGVEAGGTTTRTRARARAHAHALQLPHLLGAVRRDGRGRRAADAVRAAALVPPLVPAALATGPQLVPCVPALPAHAGGRGAVAAVRLRP